MKTTGRFLATVLSALVLFTGCYKDDINDLKNKTRDHEERLKALEAWKTTVNNNISSLQTAVTALENGDYVSGVVPVTQNGEIIGYTINFTKSNPVTIHHGPTSVVSVGLYTDDKYYWRVDDGMGAFKWLLDGAGQMIPTTGTVPQLRANSTTNMWEISTDRGATWTSTGVEIPVDPVFARDGIDNTSPDKVILTLADGTLLTLPKYKQIGISFTQPGLFTVGTAQTIAYTSTGSTPPTNIRVVDVPLGWKITVSTANKSISVIPPSTITAENSVGGEATVLVADGEHIAAMYGLSLRIDFTGPQTNAVGSVYFQNGMVTGMVYIAKTDTNSGMAVSLDQVFKWSYSTDKTFYGAEFADGLANMAIIQAADPEFDAFPAFKWVDGKNPANTQYTSGALNIWYLGSKPEMSSMYSPIFTDLQNFNNLLIQAGGTPFLRTWYWTSSESGTGNPEQAFAANYSGGNRAYSIAKNDKQSVYTRAILAFN